MVDEDDETHHEAASAEMEQTDLLNLDDAPSVHDSLLRDLARGTSGSRDGKVDEISNLRVNAEVGLQGKFLLQQEIGSGAMGRVYRALDRYLLRDVAIKFILRPETMEYDEFMALFWQEAHAIARLDQHDNIVRIFDVDRSTYPPYIVMEYLEGESVEKKLRRGALDVATVLHIVTAAACGLSEAHLKGIYHRDLKPSNIFVLKTGRVKLLDFGLARIQSHRFEASTTRARSAAAHVVPRLASAGTPAYMAPEQWRGEDADAATDLWGMGALLYRMLANAPPFEASSLAALSDRVLSGEPPVPLATLRPEVPSEVCTLVERLLHFDRSARPSNTAEIIAVLESSLRKLQSDNQQSGGSPGAPQRPSVRAGEATSAGDRHGSDRRSSNAVRFWDKLLLVVVSGSDSGSHAADERLPAWIFNEAGLDCHALNCPPVQPGDIGESALRLHAYLNGPTVRARHIFFVTHGHGTDVVLRMLLDESRRLSALEDGNIAFDAKSPFYRIRHVAILRPGRGIATAHHVAGVHVGQNATPLVAELISELQQFLAVAAPTPAIHYVGIDDKSPLHAKSACVKSLAMALTRPGLMLARVTIARTFELDCANKIASLVGPVDGADRDDDRPTVPGAELVTQAEVCEDVLALVRSQHHRPLVTVIAGDVGVGKSTVLRRAARQLCVEFVNDGGAVLPMLIPLDFASLSTDQVALLSADSSEDRRGRVLFDVLLDWWSNWLNGTMYPNAVTSDWAKARLRSEPVALIFDGLDEFFMNHPTLSILDFQQMLTFLAAEHRKNGWLSIVLGVRSTQPGISALASSNLREVRRLTCAQAMRHFPVASSQLSTANAPLPKVLSTPLILARLNVRRASYDPGVEPRSSVIAKQTTNSEVTLLALTTIIEESDLCGRRDETGQPIDAQRWIDALTAVAWSLYRRLRGDIATATLKADGADLHRSWKHYLEATQQQVQGERILSGFHLLCESRAWEALLRRTILYLTDRGEVRFIHREWQDFLAARYLVQAVVYRKVDEFRHVGNTARISRVAGELLGHAGICIDEPLVLELLRCTDDSDGKLIIGNISALLTNSRVPIDGPALDILLSTVSHAPASARYIALSGLGYRALRGDDSSAQDLRHRLTRLFQNYLSITRDDDDSGVTRSLAWCYRKAYAQRFGGPPVRDDWPGLDADAERGALAMMCSMTEDGPRMRVEHRSIQRALLEVQQTVPADPFRPISAVHYLYCLGVARRDGAGIADLGRELPALVAPGSPYAAAIESYQLVPELSEVLAACRRFELG